ncbi:MAG: outer membrane protein assembly factor BamA [Candidatus Alcyoniella australis]|nr:outer membrane protein assembly factor BamA [Candidatus Alcyoniella australis]
MRRTLLPLLLLICCAVLWPGGMARAVEQVTLEEVQHAQYGTEYWGETIYKLRLLLPENMNRGRVERSIKLIEGRPFTPSRVRRTIERIYLMGNVSDVTVKAKHDDQGRLMVHVEVVPGYTIRSISFVGSSRFNYDELLRISRIIRGTTFEPGDLRQQRLRIREAYRDEGYFAVKVRSRHEIDQGEYAVDLFFNISEGSRYRIGGVMLSGSTGIDERAVLKKLRWRVGRVAKRKRFDRGAQRLENYYRRHGYLEAIVSEPTLVIDDSENKVYAQLQIEAGRLIDVTFEKPGFSFWQRHYKMRRVIKLKDRRRFNKWVMEDWREEVRRHLQAKGYYEADVQTQYEQPEGENIKLMSFSVERGSKVKLDRVDFTGNAEFEEKQLRRELDVGNSYVPELFTAGLTRVQRKYQSEGYLRVKLDEPEVDYEAQRRRIVVKVNLEEGPRTHISGIEFEGNQVYQSDELAATLKPLFAAGDPLDPWKLEGSSTRVLQVYFQNGYIRARVKHRLEFNEDRTQVRIVYTVTEGQQYFFGNVYIRGNVLTRDHVIRRELYIEQDEPFDYGLIVESEQNLNALGLFKSVRIAPVKADLSDQVVDLICEVTERRSGTIEWGVGYNTADGYNASFEIAHRNLAGHGRKLTFSNDLWITDPSFVLSSRSSSVGFLWPWIARWPMNGRIVFGNELSEEISYKKSVYSISPGVELPLGKFFRWLRSTRDNKWLVNGSRNITLGLDYTFEQNFIYKIDEDVIEDRGFLKIASVTPQAIRDSRNDPYNPTSGSVNSLVLEYSTQPLQSDVHYLKFVGRTSWYFPLFRALPPLKGLVFAMQLRGGHAQSLEDDLEVPITKRFFLGGSTTIRGFANDEISPLGDDGKTPVGGLAMAHANQELRFPIAWGLGGLLFFDAGTVWTDANHVDISELRTSAGVGLRYLTPVGPISADYGFKLDRLKDETPGEFYITIGNAF